MRAGQARRMRAPRKVRTKGVSRPGEVLPVFRKEELAASPQAEGRQNLKAGPGHGHQPTPRGRGGRRQEVLGVTVRPDRPGRTWRGRKKERGPKPPADQAYRTHSRNRTVAHTRTFAATAHGRELAIRRITGTPQSRASGSIVPRSRGPRPWTPRT